MTDETILLEQAHVRVRVEFEDGARDTLCISHHNNYYSCVMLDKQAAEMAIKVLQEYLIKKEVGL